MQLWSPYLCSLCMPIYLGHRDSPPPSQAKIINSHHSNHMVTFNWMDDWGKFLNSLPFMWHKWWLPFLLTIRTLVQGSRIFLPLWIYIVVVNYAGEHGIKHPSSRLQLPWPCIQWAWPYLNAFKVTPCPNRAFAGSDTPFFLFLLATQKGGWWSGACLDPLLPLCSPP